MRVTAGTLRGREIVSPKGLEVRPSSSRLREAVFNMCQSEIVGARFLDLYAGSGIMGIEALSRGAKSAHFVDIGKESIKVIRQNLERLNLSGEVYAREVLTALKSLSGSKFDMIYADPPYHQHIEVEQLLLRLDVGDFLVPGGRLFVEFGNELNFVLHNLELKRIRTYGRAFLHCFESNP